MDLDELVLAYQMNRINITYMSGYVACLCFSRIKVYTCHLKLDLNLLDQNNGRDQPFVTSKEKGQKYRREIVSVNHLYINEGMIANFITFFQWFLFPIENIVDIVNPFKLWSNYRVTFTLLKYGWEKGKRKCWNFANNWSSVLFLFHLEREMCFALLPF